MRTIILSICLIVVGGTTVTGCATAHRPTVAPPYSPATAQYAPDSVYRVMKKVADWQLSHFYPNEEPEHSLGDWTNCALYTGILAFGKIANDTSYDTRLRAVGTALDWQLSHGDDRYFADNYCIGQMYASMYRMHQQPHMIADLVSLADTLLARPHTESLEWKRHVSWREWAWCDALFMGPPPLAFLASVTHQRKYLDLADALWWKTTDYLYDPHEHLYFRDSRFFGQRETNGKKIFWSRGNGWVMSGLVRMLDNMPADYPDRGRWVRLYRDMARTIASLQQPDGTWSSSLLNPNAYPDKETSGTGFYCYALAWGINHGLLSRHTYEPVVRKAWDGLTSSVHPDGKLGFVQEIGAAPGKVGYDDTEVYGVGAFLLAGTEVMRMTMHDDPMTLTVAVENPTSMHRQDELVELSWKPLMVKYGATLRENTLVITNALTDEEIPYQVIHDGQKHPKSVIMPITLAPAATAFYHVRVGVPHAYVRKTYGRFVPERLDDFAWENDRIAFRMYGPALQKTGDVSNGIDVWVKRTDSLVIDTWYRLNDYHHDHGQGLDAYEVGTTLGAGGTAPYVDHRLWRGGNYATYRVLDNGPLRTTFVLTYPPFDVAGHPVRETRTISLDAGSQLNKIRDDYTTLDASMPVAIGLAEHGRSGQSHYDTLSHTVGYWEAADGQNNGMIGTGVVVPEAGEATMTTADGHLLLIVPYSRGVPLTYYQGAGWDKSGRFPDAHAWFDYLETFAQTLRTPLVMHIVH